MSLTDPARRLILTAIASVPGLAFARSSLGANRPTTSQPKATGQESVIRELAGVATTRERLASAIASGAIGDGRSAARDRAGFNAMMAQIRASRSAAPTGKLGFTEFSTGAELEPGIYDVGSIAVQDGYFRLAARIPGTVIIRLPDEEDGFLLGGGIVGSFIRGITFIGGRRQIAWVNSSSNVTTLHSIEECMFIDYLHSGLSNESSDMPYFKIKNNIFHSNKIGSVGIALGGLLDGLSIKDNAFTNNSYHIKLGSNETSLSGSFYISNNDFISFGNPTEADIWIIPRLAEKTGGSGAIISENKFGNEGKIGSKPRILIALEDRSSGQYRASFKPAKIISGLREENAILGLSIVRNRFDSRDTAVGPVVLSYALDIRSIEWAGNIYGGGFHTYAFEFAAGRKNSYVNTDWDVDIRPGSFDGGLSPFLHSFANVAINQIVDRAGLLSGQPGAMLAAPADDHAEFLQVARMATFEEWTGGNGIARQAVLDELGGMNGCQYIATAPQHVAYIPLSTMPAERQAYLQFTMKAGDPNSIGLQVNVTVRSSQGIILAQRRYVLTERATRFVVPFITADIASAGQVDIEFHNPTKSGRRTFICSQGLVNIGRSPGSLGNIHTRGTGRWDGAHIILGTHHIWVDDADKLRIKNGAPASSIDGQLV